MDYVADCGDLSQIASESVTALYASHVLEHVPYAEVQRTLKEWHRVLKPGAKLMVAVPDLNILAQLFLKPEVKGDNKFLLVQMMFGGQSDEHDFHCVGFDLEILGTHLFAAGFVDIRRVSTFGLFDDSSLAKFHGIAISLNVEARRRD